MPLVAPHVVSRAIAFHSKIFNRREGMQVSTLWLRRGVVESVRYPRLKTCVPALEVAVTLVIRSSPGTRWVWARSAMLVQGFYILPHSMREPHGTL